MNKALFSSNRQDWETPTDFFKKYDDGFNFTLDACATPQNAKCGKYFTKEDDGLTKDWGGNRVWCNPPYGCEISKWVKKASEEAQKPHTIVVMLLPARTDTAWFHDYILGKASIQFIRGRIKFVGATTSAPFPSMVVTFASAMFVPK